MRGVASPGVGIRDIESGYESHNPPTSTSKIWTQRKGIAFLGKRFPTSNGPKTNSRTTLGARKLPLSLETDRAESETLGAGKSLPEIYSRK